MTADAVARGGYRMVLPPGWAMVPLRERTDQVIEATIDTLLTGVPADSRAPRAHRIRTWLTQIADDARRSGGLDLILPIVPQWLQPASVSIIMSSAAAGADVTTAAQLRRTAQNHAAVSLVDTLAGPALREQLSRPDPGETDQPEPAESITYSWVPRAGRVIVGTLVVTAAGFEGRQTVVDALVELGESMLSSVRFDGEA